MSRELYFLRSSESKIVKDMVKYAHPQSDANTSIYTEFYGLTPKDLGLYALVSNKVAGAIWSRELEGNTQTPILSMAVLPTLRNQGIGSFMMEQFLQELAVKYEQIQVDASDTRAIKFYEKFGFHKADESHTLIKKLEKKELIRPSDGYDPRRWMD